MAIREANFKLRLAAECLKSNFSALTSLKRDERIETWFFFFLGIPTVQQCLM